jgi:hypothetical protein
MMDAWPAQTGRVRPELVADGPDQVWTWDITKLKSQWRGFYFDLYVMLDIYSRKAGRRPCRAGTGRSQRPGAGQMFLHLRFEEPDLLVEDGQGPDGRGVGAGQRGGLPEMLAAQRGQDRVVLRRDMVAAGALERGGHLGAGQLRL